jgi:O-antigen/teichoic acid export membrane protein
MKKELLFTFGAQMLILFSGLAVYKLAMMHFGTAGFAEFSIAKRNSAYLNALILLGLGVAIPKFIAMERGKKSDNESSVFLSGLLILAVSLTIAAIAFFVFGEKIAFALFGDAQYASFLFAFFVSILGLCLHSIVYDYYRGRINFGYAVFIQIINLGLVPLVVFLFSKNNTELFLYSGLIMLAVSGIALAKILITLHYKNTHLDIFLPKLFAYGIHRLPADFGLASLLALPAIFAAHTMSVTEAGFIAFSISLLSLSGQAAAPIALVMLPKISHLMGEQNFALIAHYTKRFALLFVAISITGTLLYQIFTKELLTLYLGNTDPKLVEISKIVMWGGLFYPFYVAMRGIIDGYYNKAYNTVSILVALGFFLLLSVLTEDNPLSLVFAIAILAAMTLYFIKPILSKSQP